MKPRIALVHDFLMQHGGAENVTLAFSELFPDAPIYTLFYRKNFIGKAFDEKDIRTSYLQKVPFPFGKYQWALPFMVPAIESLDFSAYDIVLSSSNVHGKGIIVPESTIHIAYCHTPARYLWRETASYVANLHYPGWMKPFITLYLSHLREWDYLAAQRPDYYLANSRHVEERIRKYYKRESHVIYPPVEMGEFSLGSGEGDYFLAGGRLVAYKRYDMVIRAFNRLRMPLVVFGSGPELKKLKKMAGENIRFTGRISSLERTKLYQNCRAFLFPQIEDAGITPIEAFACGRPVIAYRAGGVVETLIEGVTGEFFDWEEWEALADKVVRFDPKKYDPKKIREHALKFSKERFKKEIYDFVMEKYAHRS